MLVIRSCWLLLIVILQNPNCVYCVNRKFTILHTQTPDPGAWKEAHATFYGYNDGITDMGGVCGFGDVMKGYGEYNTALSPVLFKDHDACGGCYEIKCFNNSHWCKPEGASVIVTATNFCPPNTSKPNDNGGWCNPPREHFALSQPAFLQLADQKAEIMPVQYRRVPCVRQGGIQFALSARHAYTLVLLVWNVGGPGDITAVEIKQNDKEWEKMKHAWGNKWEVGMPTGSLSFKVHGSDGRVVECPKVVPSNWKLNQTFEGKNF